jgi:transcriptional regulator with XRE-family HTH domain
MELTTPLFRALLAEHSQKPLASALAVAPSTISRWAGATRDPYLDDALRALRALGYTVTVAPSDAEAAGPESRLGRAALAVRRVTGA